MPIYEYKCNQCGSTCEVLHKTLTPKAVSCPQCQSQDLERLISTPGAVMAKSSAPELPAAGCPNKDRCGMAGCPGMAG